MPVPEDRKQTTRRDEGAAHRDAALRRRGMKDEFNPVGSVTALVAGLVVLVVAALIYWL